jgi:hypothetical protein
MAQAKQKLKVIYHTFFCGDNIGEADGFFEINGGKLEYVTGWDANDANWRGEYMGGLLRHAGAEIKELPDKYQYDAERLIEKAFGLVGDEEESEGGEREDEHAQLYYRRGTSDKVYNISLSSENGGWFVTVEYGRRNGSLKTEIKCAGITYADAYKIYDKILTEKHKKGYKYAA